MFGRRQTFLLLAAAACGLAFWAIGYIVLSAVHPADDAYILYRYADHMAAGRGIVFNPDGPPAEGATDFLWLVLLAAGVALGGDVALVSLGLNALGAAVAAYLIARLSWGAMERPPRARLSLCVALPSTFLTGGALAGYWGFSSMLYSALILLLFAVAVEARGRMVLLVPAVGVTVALLRPDGVVIGVAFALLGLLQAREERLLRAYVVATALCAAGATAYFIWRWNYFGLPIPLPLYVKQNSGLAGGGLLGALPGLRENVDWFFDPRGPKFLVAGAIGLVVMGRLWRDGGFWRLVIAMLPLGLLIVTLGFAVQSQNVALRFQAPAYLAMVYFLVSAAARVIDERRQALAQWLAVALVAAAVVPAGRAGVRAIEEHRRGMWTTYLEALAPRIGPLLPSDSIIALTEAGVVPYWTSASVADIVGLNYPPAAVRPQTLDDLRRLRPDVVFFNHANSLDRERLASIGGEGTRIFRVRPDNLGASLLPGRRQTLARGAASYEEAGLPHVEYAATILTQFLSESTEYDLIVIDPNLRRTFPHVWGIRREWPHREMVLEGLHWALDPQNYRSYLSLKREFRAAPG
jgi:hypothetical protein